jgi:hypothetical protein
MIRYLRSSVGNVRSLRSASGVDWPPKTQIAELTFRQLGDRGFFVTPAASRRKRGPVALRRRLSPVVPFRATGPSRATLPLGTAVVKKAAKGGHGLLGGLAGWLIDGDLMLLGALLLASGSVLTIAAYVMAARRGGNAVEGTTEVAALVVLALGAIATLGFPLVTSAVAVVMVLALVEKTRIHSAIERLGERELKAALQFAVLAVVILPLLPAGPFGPYDSIRPRAIWVVVLLFSGLNFAGYLISRWLGTSRG